ncbi:unnamed protein product [Fraxinus pennsylvanica]|uniref:SURF1-like protein n=1 Tax=Fraxinus pennsylvanica TaxID=56036 RepID=A0AAD2EG87_9LAMI|nr:unnamed protein product [Fraxinus pennsylvanica]
MAAASISRTIERNLRPINLSKWLPPSSLFSTTAPGISTVPQQPQGSNKERSTWSKVLLFVPGAITFGLGTWQIFRRQDKIKMLEFRQNRLGLEPLKSIEIATSSGNFDSLEFRRVQCRGFFDEKKSIYVGPRSRSISGVTENGYYLITPLLPIPDDPNSLQTPILVNRGWVPRSWRDKALKVFEDDDRLSGASTPAQESAESSWWRFWSKKPIIVEEHSPAINSVEVLGVVRGSEKPSIFVPANDPSAAQWFYVDVPAIAQACGLPENTLYIEDINDNVNPSSPYPVPKEANTLIRSSVMPQDHLNYTLTWYSLSAAVTFMAIKRLKQKKRRR